MCCGRKSLRRAPVYYAMSIVFNWSGFKTAMIFHGKVKDPQVSSSRNYFLAAS
ncbi:unnamed protein product, partial [Linum tenue]